MRTARFCYQGGIVMEEYKTKRIHYVEVAKDIYAAITPADGLDITDAGMMDNFSKLIKDSFNFPEKS